MTKLNGKALLPGRFVTNWVIPAAITDPQTPRMALQQIRKYFFPKNPDKDVPVGQISLRVNEACNLRCGSCGQWGENGHLRKKLERGEKLGQLDFDVVKRVIFETRRDKPFYYVWGGEPTMWRPLVPFFEELAKHKLRGSIVTNAQDLDRVIEDIIATGALSILFLSLDGWDSESQNVMRAPAGGGVSDNFERTMAVMEKVKEIKARKKLKFPMVIPITVISNSNYARLTEIHKLVFDKAQLHPYYFGWFITPQRAEMHEKIFETRFGCKPKNYEGYLKSCFNDVDPKVTAEQIKEIKTMSKGKVCIPQFIPGIETEKEIRRYYSDHSWHCGYPKCESIYYVAEVSPDGRVTPCRDYQDFTAGNINEQGFYDIWNGEEFKRFRREMKKGLMPVCTRCCGLQGF
ncbi:MAG: SPASM domain-containing protein [Chitinispirillales bacterium]|jgi:radical SAM protein with 4Fe4S-binding SPASM domain|nr:SPASM domain-containing protein [Chitinispirillales bacterium]